MAELILVMGDTGTGKSHSIKMLDPKKTFVINCDNKRLPFKGSSENYVTNLTDKGDIAYSRSNIMVPKSNNPWKDIGHALTMISEKKVDIDVVVIDTITMTMTEEFMSMSKIEGYGKFTEMALSPWNLLKDIKKLRSNLVVVVMAHTEVEEGKTSFFVPGGKLIKEKAKPVTVVETVLETKVLFKETPPNEYLFITQNTGSNQAKSPEGMFETHFIPNDLSFVIQKYKEYYNLK